MNTSNRRQGRDGLERGFPGSHRRRSHRSHWQTGPSRYTGGSLRNERPYTKPNRAPLCPVSVAVPRVSAGDPVSAQPAEGAVWVTLESDVGMSRSVGVRRATPLGRQRVREKPAGSLGVGGRMGAWESEPGCHPEPAAGRPCDPRLLRLSQSPFLLWGPKLHPQTWEKASTTSLLTARSPPECGIVTHLP